MKTISFCNISLVFLTLLASPGASAQGGSVNGPDQAGKSIPLLTEGEIPLTTFNRAIGTCYKEITSSLLTLMIGRKTGVNATEMIHQEYNVAPSPQLTVSASYDDYYKRNAFTVSGDFRCEVYNDGIRRPDLCPESNLQLILQPQDLFAYKPSEPWWKRKHRAVLNHYVNSNISVVYILGEEHFSYGKKEVHLQWTLLGTPQIHGTVKDRSVYSSGGEILESQQFVTDAKLEVAPEVDLEHLQIQTSYNRTGVPTQNRPRVIDLTFDFSTVVNCLKHELGKPSK